MRHTFSCVDGHTCGNPVRLVAGGHPPLVGASASEMRQHFIREFDWIRTSLMFEPRGHDMMSGAFFYPPRDAANDAAIIFMETSGCLPMCGHGTIGAITIGLETGVLQARDPKHVRLEAPAGLIEAEVDWNGPLVDGVRIRNVPSYLAAEGIEIECPEIGPLKVDVAYGGNFYAIIEPQKNYPGLDEFSVSQIVRLSPIVRKLMREAIEPVHPNDSTVRGVSHVMWTDKPKNPKAHARNAVFYGEKAIDRSPCGTGTSARMAQLAAQGKLKVGDDFVHESIIGTLFEGRVEAQARVGNHAAIVPSVKGWARVTGFNTIFVDDRDPLWRGFTVA
ncbi:MAG TPA: 4-hydroxyproline epimerase [Rhizomicrobium sp.]|jgi:4-hydroxyproline epimerase|nr:4-hydroxyproline epimerase [Rhizomicrobium sp.]